MNDTLPEYLRPGEVPRHFSISRSTVYNLMAAGLIESASLRRPGLKRGARLISVKSLRSYLGSLSDATKVSP